MLRECPDSKVRFALSMTWDRLSRSLMPVVAEPVPCPRAFVVEFADILGISFPTLHMFAPWCHVIVNAQHPASRCTHHDVSPVLSFHLKKAPSSQTNTLLHTHMCQTCWCEDWIILELHGITTYITTYCRDLQGIYIWYMNTDTHLSLFHEGPVHPPMTRHGSPDFMG